MMKLIIKPRFTKYYFNIGLVWYLIFAWYDLWIGIYFDRKTGKIYIYLSYPYYCYCIEIYNHQK